MQSLSSDVSQNGPVSLLISYTRWFSKLTGHDWNPEDFLRRSFALTALRKWSCTFYLASVEPRSTLHSRKRVSSRLILRAPACSLICVDLDLTRLWMKSFLVDFIILLLIARCHNSKRMFRKDKIQIQYETYNTKYCRYTPNTFNLFNLIIVSLFHQWHL